MALVELGILFPKTAALFVLNTQYSRTDKQTFQYIEQTVLLKPSLKWLKEPFSMWYKGKKNLKNYYIAMAVFPLNAISVNEMDALPIYCH